MREGPPERSLQEEGWACGADPSGMEVPSVAGQAQGGRPADHLACPASSVGSAAEWRRGRQGQCALETGKEGRADGGAGSVSERKFQTVLSPQGWPAGLPALQRHVGVALLQNGSSQSPVLMICSLLRNCSHCARWDWSLQRTNRTLPGRSRSACRWHICSEKRKVSPHQCLGVV